MPASTSDAPRLPSGVPGFDEVLLGGLPRGALILIKGPPGSGKTTMGLQFLLHAVQRGEVALLASNAETPKQLHSIIESHGWRFEGLHIAELAEPNGAEEHADADYTLFPEAEVEIGETLQHLFSEVERLKPTLLVLDTISSLRVLSPTPAFHRRQLKRIRDFTAARSCTTVMLDEAALTEKDLRSETFSDGVIELELLQSNYGADRRRLRVRKLRGCTFLSGAHDFTIAKGGLVVYPRLVASSYQPEPASDSVNTGIDEIFALTGGGLPRGSSTLLIGPAGIGKSSIATLYLMAAAKHGENSCVILFDESVETHLTRSQGLGLELRAARDAGLVHMFHLDPAELSVGQITDLLIKQVEKEGAKLVVIDTLNGYLQSAIEEQAVLLHLRELISYLGRRRIVTLLTLTQHGLLGAEMSSPIDLSFLSDNIILLRYFEIDGAIRKALSVVKKRTGMHETTIRELVLSPGSISVSEPLAGCSGVLTGAPVFRQAPGSKGS
jgi:circadian clock protein KaiC